MLTLGAVQLGSDYAAEVDFGSTNGALRRIAEVPFGAFPFEIMLTLVPCNLAVTTLPKWTSAVRTEPFAVSPKSPSALFHSKSC
ncbi:MAG: hypothetical protein K9J46_23720 [Saprospiraceae bacterium]|nr:hypothetical protein [Saprospiraceae bacterium]MCF8282833.1 hypothetical protein [Bacteroidales bacterium]